MDLLQTARRVVSSSQSHYDSTLALNNGGDQLTLRDASSNVIDFVAWETGYNSAYPTWTVSAVDTTIVRIADGNNLPIDTDSGSDWVDSGTVGTPGSGYGIGDSQSPLVTITSPADSSYVAGTVAINCNASEMPAAVRRAADTCRSSG